MALRVVEDAWSAGDLPREVIATVGNFDGIHRGQRRILDLVTGRARETGLEPVAVTFDPHPLAVLRPESAPLRLTTRAQKEALLAAAGISTLAVVRFTPAFAEIPARRFVRELLVDRLAVRELYVGSRFAFGHGREGDLSLLRSMGESFGFAAFGVEEVIDRGEAVSSTRIRRAVAAGEAALAAQLLGRPYEIAGFVVRGDGRGQGLGWPTLNIQSDNELIPADGVYVTRVSFPGRGVMHASVTNVGTRPTVYADHPRLVETHVLDFADDVYGERVELGFLRRLREERRFPDLDALRSQIGRDVEAAREYFRTDACYQRGTGGGGAAGR